MDQMQLVNKLQDLQLWLQRGRIRRQVLMSFSQPLTVRQIANRSGLTLKRCSEAVVDLWAAGCLACLNPKARASRVYWMTRLGASCQKLLFSRCELAGPHYFFPAVNWNLYGSLCSSQRRAVVLALTKPMQPARIKRAALSRDPRLRMSANNCRDVIKFLHGAGVVCRAWNKSSRHPLYELTVQGRTLRELLSRASPPSW